MFYSSSVYLLTAENTDTCLYQTYAFLLERQTHYQPSFFSSLNIFRVDRYSYQFVCGVTLRHGSNMSLRLPSNLRFSFSFLNVHIIGMSTVPVLYNVLLALFVFMCVTVCLNEYVHVARRGHWIPETGIM